MSEKDTICVGQSKAPFSWLPNYLVNNESVSADALACALYLNGKPEGWRCRPFDIRKRFGWGDYTWRKVAKELRDLNLLHERATQEGIMLWFEIVQTDSADVEFRQQRPATVGNQRTYKERDTNKDINKNKESKARAQNFEQQAQTTSTTIPQLIAKTKKLGLHEGLVMKIIISKGIDNVSNAIDLYQKRNITPPNPYAWLNKCIREKFWEEEEMIQEAQEDQEAQEVQEENAAMTAPKDCGRVLSLGQYLFEARHTNLYKEALAALEADGVIQPVGYVGLGKGLSDSEYVDAEDRFNIQLSDKMKELEQRR